MCLQKIKGGIVRIVLTLTHFSFTIRENCNFYLERFFEISYFAPLFLFMHVIDNYEEVTYI